MKGTYYYWITEEMGYAVVYKHRSGPTKAQAIYSKELDRDGQSAAEKYLHVRLAENGTVSKVETPAEVVKAAAAIQAEVPGQVWKRVVE